MATFAKPVVSFEIKDQKDVYRCGDIVEGLVRLRQPKPINVSHVFVALRGYALSRFGLADFSGMYSVDHCLIEEQKNVINGPTELEAGNHQYTFRFEIPYTSGASNPSPFKEPSRLYTNQASHNLPGSFEQLRKDVTADNILCRVSYGIYLVIMSGRSKSNLIAAKTLGIEEKDPSVSINVQPFRGKYEPKWNIQTYQSVEQARTPLLKHPNNVPDRSLTLKEKLSSTLKPNSTPALTFTLLLRVPFNSIIGQALPIFLSWQPDPNRSTTEATPEVVVKEISIAFQALTAIRGLEEGNKSFKGYKPASHSSWTRDSDFGSLNTPLTLPIDSSSSPIDLRSHLPLLVPANTHPSFRTFNIARQYQLIIKISGECAKEKFKAEFEAPINLLAPHPDDDKTGIPEFGAAQVKQMLAEAERLPTWAEAVGPNGQTAGYANGAEREKEVEPPDYYR